MEIMRDLKAEGKSIILITHKLDEIKEVADRCTIIRRGKLVDVVNVKDFKDSSQENVSVEELEFYLQEKLYNVSF